MIKDTYKKRIIKPQGVGSGIYYILNDDYKTTSQLSLLDNMLINKTTEEMDTTQDNRLPKKTTQDNDVTPKITTQDNEMKNKVDTEDEKIISNKKDKEQEILNYCSVPRSKREIIEHLGLNNLKHFEKAYLRPL